MSGSDLDLRAGAVTNSASASFNTVWIQLHCYLKGHNLRMNILQSSLTQKTDGAPPENKDCTQKSWERTSSLSGQTAYRL